MKNNELIKLYIESYENGSNDLKSLNKWLKEKGIKLVARKGKMVKLLAV